MPLQKALSPAHRANGGRARNNVGCETHDGQQVNPQIHGLQRLAADLPRPRQIIVIVTPAASGLFSAAFEGRRIIRVSRQPLLNSARILIAAGYDPAAIICIRHHSSDGNALRARLGIAARLTVDEHNGTAFACWKPFPARRSRHGSRRREEPVRGASPGVAARQALS
jgi:hypothetical protein